MSIGFKIKKLREQRNVSQNLLASELNISQSELSKIENGQTKKINFLLMHMICTYFEKDFDFFIEKKYQRNKVENTNENIKKEIKTILFPEEIIKGITILIEESKQKDEVIKILREENKILKNTK